jgi:hypothetical protein
MADSYTQMYGPMMDSLTRMWGGGGGSANPWMAPGMAAYWPWMQPGQAGMQQRHAGHRHDCGCDEGDCDGCRGDNCQCRCCVNDADLVINARLGELRVVALTIENPRRRERQVKLELGNWTTRSGSPADVRARLLPPAEFTLAACEEREVIVVVEAGLRQAQTTGTTDTVNAANREAQSFVSGLGAAAEAATNEPGPRKIPDVERCEVFYADLRVEGCETRPLRLALVLLPRDCGAFEIDCGCDCC